MSEAIKSLILKNASKVANKNDLEEIKRFYCKKYGLRTILNSDILEVYRQLVKSRKILANSKFESVLKKRAIRTISGIAPVAILTKPYPCPGSCAYCPHEKDVPVSYLSNEPTVMRAIRCQYDPYKQVVLRLKALENNGHNPNKIEIIVIGGTWSYLPDKYKYWYIANCFKAANDYSRLRNKKLSAGFSEQNFKRQLKAVYSQAEKLVNLKKILAREQKINETAKYRIIGLTLETRPDYLNEKELWQMRELGATRVEIGVQAIDDKILKLNKRGHGVKEIIDATKLLRSFGFKITYHLMPGLPGSTSKKDLAMFKTLFKEADFQPDQIKFYPTVVTKGSLLYKWFKEGKYKAYSNQELQALIVKCKAVVPEYVRIIRLIRDIPEESIIAGNKITNLRQIMKDQGVKCHCIRCREVKDGKIIAPQIKTITYPANPGQEYFISMESKDKKTLYGFCRLHLNPNHPTLKAIIRELHVYGELVPVGSKKIVQHSGFGKKLLREAEKIVLKNNLSKIWVISGIGVRNYYRKQGYRLEKTYLAKKLK
jgi:elongator complex protein 3